MQQLSMLGPRNECVFSPCVTCGSVPRCGCSTKRVYRYLLKRRIHLAGPILLWVLANPSIADEFRLDPTLTRCADFTDRLGYGEMRVANARAWISTDPKAVPPDPLAIGPDNWTTIATQAAESDLVIVGYGKLGGALGVEVLELLRRAGAKPHALKLNDDMSPSHPLYLAKALKPFPLEAA